MFLHFAIERISANAKLAGGFLYIALLQGQNRANLILFVFPQ
jgi:hypothetical protein